MIHSKVNRMYREELVCIMNAVSNSVVMYKNGGYDAYRTAAAAALAPHA